MERKRGTETSFTLMNDKEYSFGMSKRFYAACAAINGMLTNMQFLKVNGETALKNGLQPDEFLVKTAYSLADELLSQENKE